jgi:K+-transporting ATPase ATPase C chain
MKLRNDVTTSLIAIVFFTVLLGLAYPLFVTGVSQVAFHANANGSRVAGPGGSDLVAVPRMAGKRPDPRYFQPRPSADDYNPAGTFFSNRGPNQASARDFYVKQVAAYLALERRYNPGLRAGTIPIDAVTTSASGVDPHISDANARIQARRVAAIRRIPLARVMELVRDNTDGRSLGVLGEPGVNVTKLNLALDGERA